MIRLQALEDVQLPNGIKVRAGVVFDAPEAIAVELLAKGTVKVREADERGTFETKSVTNPLPPMVPNVRVPTPPAPERAMLPGAYEDRDNFVRNLVTLVGGFGYWDTYPPVNTAPPVRPSGSAAQRAPVVTLEEIKMSCRIDPDQTVEDQYLATLEMAAHIHTENYLRYAIDSSCGENIKQGILMLVAHWYRNRETVTTGRTMTGVPVPYGWEALLGLERDYPIY